MKNAQQDEARMNKVEFLKHVAKENNMNADELHKAYDAIINGIAALTSQGYELCLTGFGVFSVKTHKGHPVQFGSVKTNVKDYAVLKFSASDVVNRALRSK